MYILLWKIQLKDWKKTEIISDFLLKLDSTTLEQVGLPNIRQCISCLE